ncbi:hypothetical protein ACJMK2_005562 [Sinanodonta woodiana]|uniref:Uncharacterized protein n=1 Tax=Sinanodonta woodiana TaxID=1069815 RepID=A0ABD3VQG6_SINWO
MLFKEQGVADSPSSGLTSTEEPNMKIHESRMLTSLFNPGDMNLYIRDTNMLQLQSASETFTKNSRQNSILQNSFINKSFGPKNMLHPSEIANKTQFKVHNDILHLSKLSGGPSVTTMLNSNCNKYTANMDLFQHSKPFGIKENIGNLVFEHYMRETKTNDASTNVLQGRVISVPIPLTDIHLFNNLQENGNSGGVLISKLIRPTENRLHQHVSSPAKIAWSIREHFTSTKYPQWSTGMKQNISQDNQKPSNLHKNEPTETVNNESIVTVSDSNHSSEPNDINKTTETNLPENQMLQTNNHLTTTVKTKENEILPQNPTEKQGTNKQTKHKVTKMPPADAEFEESEVESV